MRQPIVLSLALALSAGVGSAAAKLPPPSAEAKAAGVGSFRASYIEWYFSCVSRGSCGAVKET